jgi:heptaprenylglyceryl phosphate synthase
MTPTSLATTEAPTLPRFLPLIDPDHFSDLAFYRELATIGYRQILLGGTGSEALPRMAQAIRAETDLAVVLYPAGPDAVCAADLIVLPDVMNSGAAHARPFGPAAVATALAAARTGSPYLAVAYFIQAESTACRYFEADPIRCEATLADHCRYAQMVGYHHIALDYEGPDDVEIGAVRRIKESAPGCWLTVSDEVSPARARLLAEHGVDTVILPSDLLEAANDPLALADAYHRELLA